jgi:uncharacterized membrane protein
MFAAHVGNADAATGWPWLIATHGRSAALFAVLAGVSIALMYSRRLARTQVAQGLDVRAAARHTRIRDAVRAVLLIFAGWFLSALATPVDVILDNLGVMMMLALPALRWRPGAILAAGLGLLAAGYWIVDAVRSLVPEWLFDVPVVHELWSPHYPALSWVGYVLVGLAIGRWAPWRGQELGVLAALGVTVGAGVLIAGTLAFRATGAPWLATADHSYTPVEMLSNVGVAAAVMAACLAVAPLAPRVLWPLAAAGSMTLTLYAAQIAVIAIVGHEIVWQPSNVAWLTLCAACIAFASLWKWRLGQGPLERVLSRASSGLADADAWRRKAARSGASGTMGA